MYMNVYGDVFEDDVRACVIVLLRGSILRQFQSVTQLNLRVHEVHVLS